MSKAEQAPASWDEKAAEKHAEDSFVIRRGFFIDDFTWKDSQYGLELRLSKDGFLAGQLHAHAKRDEALRVAARALEAYLSIINVSPKETKDMAVNALARLRELGVGE